VNNDKFLMRSLFSPKSPFLQRTESRYYRTTIIASNADSSNKHANISPTVGLLGDIDMEKYKDSSTAVQSHILHMLHNSWIERSS
jgi:hypothetical protein